MTRYEAMCEALEQAPESPRAKAVLRMRERIATMEALVQDGATPGLAWRITFGCPVLW